MRKVLSTYADSAAQDYVDKSADLNESIAEIAKTNSLNIEQVKRLCEMANQLVQLKLYPVDPLVQFPMANSTKIIKILNLSSDVPASADSIPSSPPTDLLKSFMEKYGPTNATSLKNPKITMIIIKKGVQKEAQKLASEKMHLEKEAEKIDLNLRHMIKLAMNNGSYTHFIKAAHELKEKEGMRYVIQKIAFWKKNHIMCHEPEKIAGVLNKEHPFVTGLNRLFEIRERLGQIKVANQRLKAIEKVAIKKLVETPSLTKEKKDTLQAKKILEEPTSKLNKQRLE